MLLDVGDAKKFMGFTSDMCVQSYAQLAAVLAGGSSGQYTSDASWLFVAKEWTTLR